MNKQKRNEKQNKTKKLHRVRFQKQQGYNASTQKNTFYIFWAESESNVTFSNNR